MSETARTLRQLARFGIVGILSNAFFYVLYLIITACGAPPIRSMTLIYAIATLQTFFFNRRWTFSHAGGFSWSLLRYIMTYALGYAVNVAMLIILVERAGLPHQAVQGLAIVSIAALMFLLQKYWVFPSRPERSKH